MEYIKNFINNIMAKKETNADKGQSSWANYEQVIKVKAKIFEQGDEHGLAHRSGLDPLKESNPNNLIPYIHAEGIGTQVMDFGTGYIVEDEQGRRCLEEKERFESKFKLKK